MMLQATTLSGLPGIRHGFSTRRGGVSDGVYASLNCGLGSNDSLINVVRNRAIVAEAVGVAPSQLVNAYQVHSAEVAPVEEPWTPGEAPRADALVTRRGGIAIAVSTADCVPVLLADATAGVIGAAHAGWRGALAGVVEATADAMERLGAKRAQIVAAIGPAISGAVYEVGPDVIQHFTESDPQSPPFFRPAERNGHALFDLPAYVAARLRRACVQHIEDTAVCTYRNEAEHFSYRRATHRRDPDYGRHLSVIALG
jgi:polyphenol oxidase